MKKIALPTMSPPDNKGIRTSQNQYRVYFGEGKLHLFKSRKAALAFIAESNRQLNLFLHEINNHYAELFAIYRHSWFYFLDRAKGVNRLQEETRIKTSFEIVESSLNRCIHNTSGINGNAMAFNYLLGASDQLLNICEDLRRILLIRNELVMRYKTEVMAVQIKDLQLKIENFGLSDARH